jgi:hypothetical protein
MTNKEKLMIIVESIVFLATLYAGFLFLYIIT